jgi:SAM-dependent methyltransferase
MIPFQVHRRIPFIRRPFYQRDAALAEVHALKLQLKRLQQQSQVASIMSGAQPDDMKPAAANTVPSESINYYTQQIYWNSFKAVLDAWNIAVSGRADVNWQQHMLATFGSFDKAFVLNCGNGWVERDLYKIGLIREVIGVDISEETIKGAIEAAGEAGLPSRYIVADCNQFSFDNLHVDLVVNHAAMHHVACINRVTHALSSILRDNGRYVAFDYVGPHRNQYTRDSWSALTEFNSTLPEPFRQADLRYPHIKTMIYLDPTEAVHSELQLSVLERYFEVDQFVPLGGPIAYHILFGNRALLDAEDTQEGSAVIQRILEADRKLVAKKPHTNLFAFWVARPKVRAQQQLRAWEAEENVRETAAQAAGGRYYPATALEILSDKEATRWTRPIMRESPEPPVAALPASCQVPPPSSERAVGIGVQKFLCPVCGTKHVPANDRETPDCQECGSNARFRGIVLAVLDAAFSGSRTPLVEQTQRPEVLALGTSDSDCYASLLVRRIGYENTYYHIPPQLDICNPEQCVARGPVDIVICSDVIEHTTKPPATVLANLRRILRPGGTLILSAPTFDFDITIEWYPAATELRIHHDDADNYLVRWTDRRGVTYVDDKPRFHGGPGATLERRMIAHGELMTAGRSLFASCAELQFEPEYGYDWPLSPFPDPAANGATLDARIIVMRRD